MKQFKMKQKNKNEDFLVCYQVHQLQVLVYQEIINSKGTIRAGEGAIAMTQGRKANMPGQGTIRAGKDTIRANQDF